MLRAVRSDWPIAVRSGPGPGSRRPVRTGRSGSGRGPRGGLRRAGHKAGAAGAWLPVHDWDAKQVWERIASADTRPHPVYAAGMPRLSCRFCVLASCSALVLAARLDPDGAERRAAMEERMGHHFRNDLAMRDIVAEAKTAAGPVAVEDWAA